MIEFFGTMFDQDILLLKGIIVGVIGILITQIIFTFGLYSELQDIKLLINKEVQDE